MNSSKLITKPNSTSAWIALEFSRKYAWVASFEGAQQIERDYAQIRVETAGLPLKVETRLTISSLRKKQVLKKQEQFWLDQSKAWKGAYKTLLISIGYSEVYDAQWKQMLKDGKTRFLLGKREVEENLAIL